MLWTNLIPNKPRAISAHVRERRPLQRGMLLNQLDLSYIQVVAKEGINDADGVLSKRTSIFQCLDRGIASSGVLYASLLIDTTAYGTNELCELSP